MYHLRKLISKNGMDASMVYGLRNSVRSARVRSIIVETPGLMQLYSLWSTDRAFREASRIYESPLSTLALTSYPRLCFRPAPQIGAHLIEIRISRVFKIMIRANDALKRIALSHEVHRRW